MAEQQIGAEGRGGGAKQQVAALARLDWPVGLQCHVDLGARIIQPHGPGLLQEIGVPGLGTHEIQHGAQQVGVRDDRPGLDQFPVDCDSFDSAFRFYCMSF